MERVQASELGLAEVIALFQAEGCPLTLSELPDERWVALYQKPGQPIGAAPRQVGPTRLAAARKAWQAYTDEAELRVLEAEV